MDIDNKTVAQVVSDDYRTAEVFKKHGIDFCCGGKRLVTETCGKKNVDFNLLEQELQEITREPSDDVPDFKQWPLDQLVDYILQTHHTYIKRNLPLLREFSDKVALVHGNANPEVIKINKLVIELGNDLDMHMHKEENILFPFIKTLAEASSSAFSNTSPFGSIQNPINMMEAEHDIAGDMLKRIEKLSNSFTPPEHACNTFRVLYHKLSEFQDDLFTHIHLENNILFPKALLLEKSMQQ